MPFPSQHIGQPDAGDKIDTKREQPSARGRSDRRSSQRDLFVAAVDNLAAAYEACRNTITDSRGLRATTCGEQSLGIIDRRVDWLKKDAMGSRARKSEGLMKAERLGLNVTLDITSFTQRLRSEEDKLRQTRAKLLQYVADKPSRLSRRIEEGGPTYEEKIKMRLREAYGQSREAVARYERPLHEAIAKEEARRRLEAQRRNGGPPRRDTRRPV